MNKNIASVSGPRKIQNMSSPQLVASIRRLSHRHVVYKLQNDERARLTAYMLHAALAEAKRRHLTINHPEHINDDPDPPESG